MTLSEFLNSTDLGILDVRSVEIKIDRFERLSANLISNAEKVDLLVC